jgi:hypothetical protein
MNLLQYFIGGDPSRRYLGLLGYLTVNDLLMLTRTSTKLRGIVLERKLIKKVVRFGNLDPSLRR